MLTKRSMVVLLIGLNLLLVGVLVLSSYRPSAAYGQTVGSAGGFVTVTAEVGGQTYDVLYVLDVSQLKLHAFYPPDVSSRQLVYGQFRNLKADFGRK